MGTLINFIALLSYVLYWRVPKSQRYLEPPSRLLSLVSSGGFVAAVVMFIRTVAGYRFSDLDRILWSVVMLVVSIYNVSLFVYAKFSSSAPSEGDTLLDR